MNYLLNSAVITAPGLYKYELLDDIDEAKDWLSKQEWKSTIGYPETAQALSEITGISIPCNRETIKMGMGEEALVFRLIFPQGYRPDPAKKGNMGKEFILKNCEIGLLRRLP
jgi:hypothetical protein